MYLLILNLGIGEIILMILIYLIFFGAKDFPSMMRDFGRIVYKVKSTLNDITNEIDINKSK
jgi:Sec-independent protein translocase protein TatA